MIKFTIDGKEISAQPGQTVLEAAMGCSRIDQVSRPQLPDSPQSLERRMVNKELNPPSQSDVLKLRTSYTARGHETEFGNGGQECGKTCRQEASAGRLPTLPNLPALVMA